MYNTGRQTVYGAGFNAFSQLRLDTDEDIRAFQPLSLPPDCPSDVEILYTCWSTTLLTDAGRSIVWRLGYQQLHQDAEGTSRTVPNGVVGDHDGLRGALNERGELMWVQPGTEMDMNDQLMPVASSHLPLVGLNRLISIAAKNNKPLSHIAAAGNGEVVAIHRSKQDNSMQTLQCADFESLITAFTDFQQLKAWYKMPGHKFQSPLEPDVQTFSVPVKAKNLVANMGNFLLLTEAGEVYSWGDPRYQSLGRLISDTQADQPGILEALGGLRIVKVASGGWNSAALSEDGALYLWGVASMPGHEDAGIRCLREADVGEVVLVAISGDDGEPADVLDVAIGDGHIAVVTAHAGGNRLYVVGQNRNGQLGIGSDAEFLEDWTEVPAMRGVTRVVCGPKCTFAFRASRT